MAKKTRWDLVRKKNPLVKRNAWVFAQGEWWRIANTDGDHVLLRKQIYVHPADILATSQGKAESETPTT